MRDVMYWCAVLRRFTHVLIAASRNSHTYANEDSRWMFTPESFTSFAFWFKAAIPRLGDRRRLSLQPIRVDRHGKPSK